MKETDLYAPVKALLEAQGYDVKGEISDCDLVAVRGDGPPVLVELKQSFTLSLVYQGVARQGISDMVYLAVPPFSGKGTRGQMASALGLCKRLGLGLMVVETSGAGDVDVLLDPAEYRPKKRAQRRVRMLREFQRRVGDPATGGASRRGPMMTAYRQDALRCAIILQRDGASKASDVAVRAGVPKARAILYRDVYGWFERVGTGIYQATPNGHKALIQFEETVQALRAGLPIPGHD